LSEKISSQSAIIGTEDLTGQSLCGPVVVVVQKSNKHDYCYETLNG
jgi:hypothetical protein